MELRLQLEQEDKELRARREAEWVCLVFHS